MQDSQNPPAASEPQAPMGISAREVLGFEEAAAFLGVSTKTFAKVMRSEDLPGRKVGREWKFSKVALLHWLASGRTRDYQDDEPAGEAEAPRPAPREAVRSVRPAASARENVIIEQFSVDED